MIPTFLLSNIEAMIVRIEKGILTAVGVDQIFIE
jgi:hypothetical protein